MHFLLSLLVQALPLGIAKPLVPAKPQQAHPRLTVNGDHREVKNPPETKVSRKPASGVYKPSLLDE